MRQFALATAAATLVLILAGGWVTTTRSGDDIPTWPNGALLGIEGTHRLIAGIVGLMVAALAVWLQLRAPRPWLRRLGWIAFAAVVVQAVLGGLRVHHHAPTLMAVIHATFAQVIFCAMTATAYFLGASRREPSAEAAAARPLALALTAFTFLQLVTGAVLRHTGEILPIHLVNAAAVLVLGSLLGSRLVLTPLRGGAFLLLGILAAQVALGIATWAIRESGFVRSAEAPILQLLTVTAHVVAGAALLAAAQVLVFQCSQVESTGKNRHDLELAGT
jgi:cytochrome c oxidase assembly protein subunit 15